MFWDPNTVKLDLGEFLRYFGACFKLYKLSSIYNSVKVLHKALDGSCKQVANYKFDNVFKSP